MIVKIVKECEGVNPFHKNFKVKPKTQNGSNSCLEYAHYGFLCWWQNAEMVRTDITGFSGYSLTVLDPINATTGFIQEDAVICEKNTFFLFSFRTSNVFTHILTLTKLQIILKVLSFIIKCYSKFKENQFSDASHKWHHIFLFPTTLNARGNKENEKYTKSHKIILKLLKMLKWFGINK